MEKCFSRGMTRSEKKQKHFIGKAVCSYISYIICLYAESDIYRTWKGCYFGNKKKNTTKNNGAKLYILFLAYFFTDVLIECDHLDIFSTNIAR